MKYYDTNPIEGAIEITTKIGCNINCKYCPQHLFVNKYKKLFPDAPVKLSLKNFIKYIESVPENVRIEFSGMSEPFLNSECIDMILYANAKGHPIGVYSTLVGIKKVDINKLKYIEFDVFCIHLPDSEENTSFTITEEYIDVLKTVVNDIKGYKYFTFQGNDVHNYVKDYVYNALQFSNIIYKRAGCDEDSSVTNSGPLQCDSDCRDNVLLPNGALLLCCQDYNINYIIGDLKTSDYNQIMQGKKLKEIKKLMFFDDNDFICRRCYFAHSKNSPKTVPDVNLLLKRNISMQWKLLDATNLIKTLKIENSHLKAKLKNEGEQK